MHLIRREVNIHLRSVRFQSGGFYLAGAVYVPEGNPAFPGVVICHPHPLYGGSMDNNVVNALCEVLAERSIIAFKFNFRGVEGSEGEFNPGEEAQEDVRAAVSFVTSLKEVDSSRIGLAGYSAGAAWGLTAAYENQHVKALAGVSPPLALFDFNVLKECRKPKLMISGSEDPYVYAEDLRAICREQPDPVECEIIEDVDHFWCGSEKELAGKVAEFFKKWL